MVFMVFLFSCPPHSKQWDPASRPCRPLSAWERVEIMSKYLLGCLSTLFISRTVGVISFPKFSGKFRLFISSQMFANLLNIHNICNTPKQTSSPANHRLLTERLILAPSVSMQYDIILMSPSQRGTQRRFSNEFECNKLHAANTVLLKALQRVGSPKLYLKKSIFSHLPPVVSIQIVSVFFVLVFEISVTAISASTLTQCNFDRGAHSSEKFKPNMSFQKQFIHFQWIWSFNEFGASVCSQNQLKWNETCHINILFTTSVWCTLWLASLQQS